MLVQDPAEGATICPSAICPGLLRAGDLLIANDSRVLPARLFGQKATGGKVELLLERVLGETEALVQLRSSHAPKAGRRAQFRSRR